MIDDNVKKVTNRKKKEREIDEKLEEDVKFVFDDFMKNQKIVDYELINKRMNEIHKMCDKILNDIEDNINPNDTKTNYLVYNMVANKTNDSDSDSDNMSDNNDKKINSKQNDKLNNLQKN